MVPHASTSPTPPTSWSWARRAPATSSGPTRAAGPATVLGDPLILVQLRDPVRRAVSNWAFSTDAGLESRPLAEALARRTWPDRCPGTRPSPRCRRTPTSSAAATPTSWHRGCDQFGDGRHVLLLEDLLDEPGAVADLYGSAGRRARRSAPRTRGCRSTPASCPSTGSTADCMGRLRDYFRRATRRSPCCWGGHCRGPDTVRPTRRASPRPRHRRSRSTGPTSTGRELDYLARVAGEGGHTASRGRSRAESSAILTAETGARGGTADDLVHRRARAERPAADLQPRRHRDRAVLHLHQHGSRLRPHGRSDPLLRHRAARRSGSTPASRRAARRLRARRRGGALRRHRLRRRRHPRGAEATGPTWPWSRTTPTACSAAGAASRSAAWAGFATLSFHETKNFVCGEGGALVLNDPADVDRAWVLYEKGTDRRAFFEGQVDKYSWRDTGSSFGLSDVLAALPAGAAREREAIQAQAATRSSRATARRSRRTPTSSGSGCPSCPTDREPAYHLFHVLLPDARMRARVIDDLREQGVAPTFHYVPLHDSEGGRRFAARPTDVPGEQRRQRPAAAAAVPQQAHRQPTWTGSPRPWSAPSGGRVTTMSEVTQRGSSSIEQPDYWWYRARTAAARGRPGRVTSGSPAPAARRRQRRRAERGVDARRPRALSRSTSTRVACTPGSGVRASALALPFRDGTFDVVAAFDVIEHCEPERPGADRAGPGARRAAGACCSRCRPTVGLVRPRRARRPPPALHPTAAGRRGRERRIPGHALHLRVRRRLPVLRRRAGRPAGPPARRPGTTTGCHRSSPAVTGC